MENITNCPVCSSEKNSLFISCLDHTVTKNNFHVIECLDCSFKYTNPRPSRHNIDEYYQSEDYISHSNSNKGLINKVYRYVRNITISKKLSLINKYVSRGTLLDIGCGTGEFLSYCAKRGWTTLGIEPGVDARKLAAENHNLNVYDESYIKNIATASYNVITMWHVLEHVHELNERIIELKRIIKEDGIIVIAVPNHTSYDAKHYKEYWAAYDLPRHLYHFSPKTINLLFQKHGFKKTET